MQNISADYTRLLVEMALLAVMIAAAISSVFVFAYLVELGGLRVIRRLLRKPRSSDQRTSVAVRRVS